MKAQISKQLFAGKFEIQGEIAKGQTGTILYGYDLGLRQEVAIKVYHSHINGRLVRGKTFIEKSKPLLLIDHPNLIKIFNVEELEDNPVVFMEFFDAPSLQHIIQEQGRLSVQNMLMLAREIADVLVHTHFQGIIHGTLHPGHVLVGPQGQVKVTDLGLSWILMDILPNCEPELLRPLPYFPPEIAKGELLNVSSDLYCLGFMMYEMLTGTVPYAGLPKTSIMGKLAFDQTDPAFDFPDTVPEVVCDLIRDMSRNNAHERIQDATQVLTIINQQLAKLTQTEELSSSQPEETTATSTAQTLPPTAIEAHNSPEAPKTVTPPAPDRPSPKKSLTVQRPKSLVDYGKAQKAEKSRKIGIAIVVILLFGIAGSLGYWYRDYLETQLSAFQVQLEPASPAAGSPQRTPNENEMTIIPTQDAVHGQEAQTGGDALTQETSQDPSESSRLPTKEQPASIEPSTPVQTLPPKRIPTSSVVVTPPSEKGTKNILPPQPATSKVPPPQSVMPVTKPPSSKPVPPPVPQQLPAKTPAASDLVPPPSEKGTKNIPPPQPATPKIPPQQSASPTTKAPIAKPTPPPVQQQLPAKTPAASDLVPPPSEKSAKNIPPRQPTTPKALPQQSVTPKTKAPITKPTPPPVPQHLPTSAPPASDVVVPPITKPLTDETTKEPASIEPPTETISQKKESTSSTPPSIDETPPPILNETKKILEPIDPSATQRSSATEKPPVEKP